MQEQLALRHGERIRVVHHLRDVQLGAAGHRNECIRHLDPGQRTLLSPQPVSRAHRIVHRGRTPAVLICRMKRNRPLHPREPSHLLVRIDLRPGLLHRAKSGRSRPAQKPAAPPARTPSRQSPGWSGWSPQIPEPSSHCSRCILRRSDPFTRQESRHGGENGTRATINPPSTPPISRSSKRRRQP